MKNKPTSQFQYLFHKFASFSWASTFTYFLLFNAVNCNCPGLLDDRDTSREETSWELGEAIKAEDLKKVKEIIKNNPSFNLNSCLGLFSTPLELAIKKGNLEVVQFLVDSGASVNKKGADYHDPLLTQAIKQGNPAIVRYLIKKGASQTEKTSVLQRTPLQVAIKRDKVEVIDVFIQETNADPQKIAFQAIDSSAHKVIDSLLKNKKLNLKQKDQDGNTLFEAALKKLAYSIKKQESEDIVIRLLQEDEIDMPLILNDSYQKTPLLEAVQEKNVNITKAILERLAKSAPLSSMINQGGNYGETPLHYAVENCLFEIIKLLISHKAAYNIKNSFGKTAEDYAKGNSTLLELLYNIQ
jgi:ankyrin repeat protein